MTSISKQTIEQTFRESLVNLSQSLGVAFNKLTVSIRYTRKWEPRIAVCENDISKHPIRIENLMNKKLIGIRVSADVLQAFFDCIHHAVLDEIGCDLPGSISMILYHSKKVGKPCIGIFKNKVAIKVHPVAELVDAMDLTKDQLN